jgi:DnaK suppressor protein
MVPEYDPLSDPHYMSAQMRDFFRTKLLTMKENLLAKEQEIQQRLKELPTVEPDHVDQGTHQELKFQETMFQEHEYQLLHAIDIALGRLDEGSYGFCEASGEPIGVDRLLIVPTTRFRLEEQKLREKFNRMNE